MTDATPTQLAAQIRFALSTIGETNDHHAFEQICFGIVRRRITSNFLPATGPVSAGGDQGRDGESHWSNLQAELPNSSAYVTTVSDETVVMACTTQREGVPTKILSDLQSITSQGAPVQRILYFTVSPVAVAKRHELQTTARDAYGVALDIYDAQAIATYLSDADLFYLAVDHLHVASALAPEPPQDSEPRPDWYQQDLTRRRAQKEFVGSLGEAVDLGYGMRHASMQDQARSDLPEWLGFAHTALAQAADTEVEAQLCYQIAWATARGYDDLTRADARVRRFFEIQRERPEDLGLLRDGINLLGLGVGAMLRQVSSIQLAEIEAWRQQMLDAIEVGKSHSPFPNRTAVLLESEARLTLQQLLVDGQLPPAEALPTFSETHSRFKEMLERGESPITTAGPVPFVDSARGMRALEALVDLLPAAPLFPVRDVADIFQWLTPSLLDHPAYARTRDGLDAAVERGGGAVARAERSRARAASLLKHGHRIEALHETHQAKAAWWQGDTVAGAVRAMLIVSGLYSRFHLSIAAKYYALSAAVSVSATIDVAERELVARGLIEAASAEYQAGNWLSAAETFVIGIAAQSQLADDPWDEDRYSYLERMRFELTMMLVAARQILPQATAFLESRLDRAGIRDLIEEGVASVADVPERSAEEWATLTDEQGIGRPFSDAGLQRIAVWHSLGQRWEVRFANNRETALAAERFIATAQIIGADFARWDPLPLPLSIEVDIRADAEGGNGHENIENLSHGDVIRYIVHVTPPGVDAPDLHAESLAIVSHIVVENALLPSEAMEEAIEAAFASGLQHKITSGRPYDDAAALFEDGIYDEMAAITPSPALRTPSEAEPASAEVAWRDGPAPGYDQGAELETIKHLYQELPATIHRSLPLLLEIPEFRATIAALREEGWKDWHILLALANAAANYRAPSRGIDTRRLTEEMRRSFLEMFRQPERVTDPLLPLTEVTADQLRGHLQLAVAAGMKRRRLESRFEFPPFDAIFLFLRHRYSYWENDVEHAPIFE